MVGRGVMGLEWARRRVGIRLVGMEGVHLDGVLGIGCHGVRMIRDMMWISEASIYQGLWYV